MYYVPGKRILRHEKGTVRMKEIITVRLETAVRDALQKVAEANGREMSEQIAHYVAEGLIADGAMPPDEAELHRQREDLIRAFLEKGVEIHGAGHRDDIIAETARQMSQDWHADYSKYVQKRDRNTINPTLGRRLKIRLKLRTGKTYSVRQPHIFTASSYLHDDLGSAGASAPAT